MFFLEKVKKMMTYRWLSSLKCGTLLILYDAYNNTIIDNMVWFRTRGHNPICFTNPFIFLGYDRRKQCIQLFVNNSICMVSIRGLIDEQKNGLELRDVEDYNNRIMLNYDQ